MDEATRRIERDSFDGDPQATLRLAQWHLRSGSVDEALAALEGDHGPGALALRAEILLGEGQLGQAADTAGDAIALDPGAVEPPLREELIDRLWEVLDGALEPLERCLTLRRLALLDGISDPPVPEDLLGRAQYARAPIWRSSAVRDARPLVRAIGRQATGAEPYPDESVPTRLFSAHGGDFETGVFVAFATSCEDRLTYFDAELFSGVDALLGPGQRHPAFGRGYGLAIPSGEATGDLDARVEAVNAAQVLPFPLQVHVHQPFDRLTGGEPGPQLGPVDARLARRFARDLATHPSRMNNAGDTAPYQRILGSFRGGNPDPDALAALLTEAEVAYGPVGLKALRLFSERAQAENERMAARRAQRGK